MCDLGLLLSAIASPQVNFDKQDLNTDLFGKTIAYMDALFRDHPFVDGNKRTEVIAAGLFLSQNGYRLTAAP